MRPVNLSPEQLRLGIISTGPVLAGRIEACKRTIESVSLGEVCVEYQTAIDVMETPPRRVNSGAER